MIEAIKVRHAAYKKHATDNGWTLGKHAENIIKRIHLNAGYCPCVHSIGGVQCPCPNHKHEVETTGRCTCGLFIKEDIGSIRNKTD